MSVPTRRSSRPHSRPHGAAEGGARWTLVAALTAAVVLAGFGAAVATPGRGGAGGPAPTVRCPAVAGRLPAVPARAQAEVARNLALLDTQVGEANRRLATSRGEGGPNFIRNAVLGPLADKRTATLDRIAIAIGRHAARPQGLEALAGCTLQGA